MTNLKIETFSAALQERHGNPRWPQISQAADYVVERIRNQKSADLMFVCTHNSRRSQFGQVWAEVFAKKYDLRSVRCYSGGTEVTECNERTVEALRRVGFEIQSEGKRNPVYRCKYSDQHPPIECFSSLFEEANLTEFAAIMCCADVDEKCPIVHGAEVRIPFHFNHSTQHVCFRSKYAPVSSHQCGPSDTSQRSGMSE